MPSQSKPQSSSQSAQGHDVSGVVLLLQVPRTNDKKELAAEQMFASLHGLLTMPTPGGLFGAGRVYRERIAFEIVVRQKRIGFYLWVPNYLKHYVEEQIYAQYPTVQISEVDDYSMDTSAHYPTTLVTEVKMIANDVLPIKTFQSFEVDPLAAITATLAKFDEFEEAWVQMIIKPADAQWHRKSEKYQSAVKSGGGMNAGKIISTLWTPPGESASGGAVKIADHEQIRVSAAEDKSQKLAYECDLRIVYRGQVQLPVAKLRLQSIIASYKQFNTTYLNGFETKRMVSDPAVIKLYQSRNMSNKGFILNIEEVATLFHLPHTNVETPFILWSTSQTAEPPANLPLVTEEARDDLSPIATTNFRGHNTMFGIKRYDRSRHLYIIGQTGVGKSGMLELLTISDIHSPYGFAVIDPHGDFAQHTMARIPPERARDVIYFNPADTEFPMAFNPMEVTDPKLKSHTASELIGVLKRMFESWGPRLEYILRYSLLALLDYPNATMLDITRILTDKKFRADVIKNCGDPVVRNFWQIEFASWNDKFAAEAVAPVLNKVGAFTANPLVRNIIGQPKSSFNIRQIMDERKILIVNLSRGLVGEDNAALLGSLLVTKVQLAAMSRADMPMDQRSPFYLYVDEFQNFATDSFATILSEARKYGLNLTVANQYTAQMAIEVKDAVFGNVGSIIAFRMGADDARGMLRYFEPKFEETDLVHMNNRHFVITMAIDGEKVPGFSAISLNLPESTGDETDFIISNSRSVYASRRAVVEEYIGERYLGATKPTAGADMQSDKPSAASSLPPASPVASHMSAQTISQAVAAAAINSPDKPDKPMEKVANKPVEIARQTHVQQPPKQEQPGEQTQPNKPVQPAAAGSSDESSKPKRKRKRNRKRKTDGAQAQSGNDNPQLNRQPGHQPDPRPSQPPVQQPNRNMQSGQSGEELIIQR